MRKSIAVLCLATSFASLAVHAAAPHKPAAPGAAIAAAPIAAGTTTTPTVHQNQFSCTPSVEADATSSTNMYKQAGTCASPNPTSTAGFTKTATALPNSCTSADLAVSVGKTNSYVFTATIGGVESGPTNCISLTTPAFSPTSATGTSY